MIGAAFNSLNIENMVTPQVSEVSGMDKKADFMSVLKKYSKEDLPDMLSDLKEIVNKAASEANVETSLDLTLARDIDEIIAELKDNLEESSETLNEENTALFEQVLIALDKLETPLQTAEETLNVQEPEILPEETTDTNTEINAEIKPANEVEDGESPLDEKALKELNIESIEADNDTGSEDSLMNRQSPQEQAVKAMMGHDSANFEVKFPSQAQNVQSKPVEITSAKIIEQITKQMEALQNTSKLNIVLNPESLGKVTIQLVKSPEGLSAQFTTATQEARDLLMKGLDGLKESLVSHGVGVDNVSVKLSDTQKSSYNPDWTDQDGSRGGNKEQGRSNRDEKEKGQFEKTMAQHNKENGNV